MATTAPTPALLVQEVQEVQEVREVREADAVASLVEVNDPASLAEVIAGCCTPLSRAPLSAQDAERLVAVLKAIAVPARLRILSMIYAREGGEACVCELTQPLGLTQPTVSHHVKVLVEAGLISREKRGVWAYYRPVPGALAALSAVFSSSP